MTRVPTVAYDANGNTLTDASGKQYSWDFENRLTSATVPGSGATTFRYDPFGRRIQKSGPLGTTNYVYDEYNVIEELDSGGNVIARNTPGSHVDEWLAQLRSGTTSYYERDGLGSVTSLTDSSGAVASSYTFDSFGKTTAATSRCMCSGMITHVFAAAALLWPGAPAFHHLQLLSRYMHEDPVRRGLVLEPEQWE